MLKATLIQFTDGDAAGDFEGDDAWWCTLFPSISSMAKCNQWLREWLRNLNRVHQAIISI